MVIQPQNKIETRLKGLPLSDGCALAKVCLFNQPKNRLLPPQYCVLPEGLDSEVARVHEAIELADAQLESIREKVEAEIGHAEAEIFVAHRMILRDPELVREVESSIRNEGVNAEAAISYVLDGYESRMEALDDDYIRDRASDFGEIRRRLLDAMGSMRPDFQCAEGECTKGRGRIVVADELTPGLTVEVDTGTTAGFVTGRGGVNSHAAILARALGIPAVSGLPDVRDTVDCGDEVLINGTTGEVILWPTPRTVRTMGLEREKGAQRMAPETPVPGFRVLANITMPGDINEARKLEAEGIGLYRTEFEMLAAGRFFTEEEMYHRYASVAEAMAGTRVLFRMFDIGSDKTMPSMNIRDEENPSLGWRGTRLLLGNRNLFETQARAIARTSYGGRVHVMYPMIIDLDQFLEIKQRFIDATRSVPQGEILHGVMFEVPSACLEAEEIFRHAEFASVGTNDLTQYLFAVDRDNELVSYDYNPDRPAMWRLLKSVSKAARAAGRPLSICGELAGDPRFTAQLIETGIDTISVSARRISGVRRMARNLLSTSASPDPGCPVAVEPN